MENLKLTKLVRNTIRNAPKRSHAFFYTNNYEKCRTVKTYALDSDGSLRAAVDQALHAAGSSNHTIKVVENKTWGGRVSHSFIVRLPK
jgi:hypothetical protein